METLSLRNRRFCDTILTLGAGHRDNREAAMANASHSGGPEPMEPPTASWSSQLRSTLQPWRLLKSILSQPVQRIAILANVSQNAEKYKGLACWRLGQQSVRDRRRKANLPADSSGKNEKKQAALLLRQAQRFPSGPLRRGRIHAYARRPCGTGNGAQARAPFSGIGGPKWRMPHTLAAV